MHSGIATIEIAPKRACERRIVWKSPTLARAEAHGFHAALIAKPAASKTLVKSAVDVLPPIAIAASPGGM